MRKQCNVQIHRMAEELSALQLVRQRTNLFRNHTKSFFSLCLSTRLFHRLQSFFPPLSRSVQIKSLKLKGPCEREKQ